MIGKSLTSGTSCSKISAATFFASGMLEMAQPFFAAQASTANLPFTSVAVVMTADAPSAAARRRARSFAPPIWPESSGMTNCIFSSMQSTAGSVFLLARYGAISRTAIPHAPMKMSASIDEKRSR